MICVWAFPARLIRVARCVCSTAPSFRKQQLHLESDLPVGSVVGGSERRDHRRDRENTLQIHHIALFAQNGPSVRSGRVSRSRPSPQARQAYVAPPIARPLLTPEQAVNIDCHSACGVREAATAPSAQAPRQYRWWHPHRKLDLGPIGISLEPARISSVPTGGRERAPGARTS